MFLFHSSLLLYECYSVIIFHLHIRKSIKVEIEISYKKRVPIGSEISLNAAVIKYRVVMFRLSLPIIEKFNSKGQRRRGRIFVRSIIHISNNTSTLFKEKHKKKSQQLNQRRTNRIRVYCYFAFESIKSAQFVRRIRDIHRHSVNLAKIHFADGSKSSKRVIVRDETIFVSIKYLLRVSKTTYNRLLIYIKANIKKSLLIYITYILFYFIYIIIIFDIY